MTKTIETMSYRVRFNNTGGKHYYEAQPVRKSSTHDKWVKVPGVTTIKNLLGKDHLIYWAAKECANFLQENWQAGQAYTQEEIDDRVERMKKAHVRKRDDAAERGTEIHELLEKKYVAAIEGRKFTASSEETYANEALKAYEAYLEAHSLNIKPVAAEKIIFDPDHWYAGTVDLIARVNDELAVVDFKTGSGIYADMGIQLAAYAMAYQKMAREDVKKRIVFNIPSSGNKVSHAVFENDYADGSAFLACRSLYKWKTNRLKPKEK